MEKLNITLGKDQNLYFTSDMHFGHRNILKFCERPFADEKQMGRALIDNWNKTVGQNDIIFNLGDFAWFNDRHSVRKIVHQLNGKKFFLLGNHCTAKQYELVEDPNFHLCEDIVVLFVRGEEGDLRFTETRCYELVLCHYPLQTWSHVGASNSFQFFGHIHSRAGRRMTEFGKELPLIPGKQMDVGCDRWDYTPIEFFRLLEETKAYK